jgi:asparagine synthase (glutamine-hydrolysing)
MPRQRAEQEVRRMVECLRHESVYATGTWEDENLGVYVGWAVRKNSFADGMPLLNENGALSLVFSGEDFPPPDAVSRLKERGHSFEADGPGYLVHRYEDDPTFPAGLNGRFHGLLTDRTKGIAVLFNDRFGMQRIYYHESKEAFYFAAEAKAILAVRPELRQVSPRSLGEFVSCGCVLENRTLFENLYVLPPASAWSFRGGSLESKQSYFQPREWEDQGPLDPEPFYHQFQQCFARSLPRYFNGREKIGLSLTGGLDTRMIMAWQKSPTGGLPCYSFGSSYRDCEDVVLARRLAAMYGQSHQVIPVGPEFLSRFSSYAERTVYLSDGCTDVSLAADLFVNEKAREIAPVRMTGNYGSEVLRWAPAFKPGRPIPGLFRPEFLQHVKAAGETYGALIQGHPISFAVFRQAPWHHYGLMALEQTQVSVRTPYLDNDLVKTAFRAPKPAFARRDTANVDLCLRLIADGNAAFRRIRTDRGLGGSDNALSAVTRRWLEFTFKAEYAYDYGMPQWLARIDHTFSALHFEKLFLGRHKFAHYRIWYRDALSRYVQEMLLDSRTLARPYLQPECVETIVRGHVRGDRNYTSAIHKLLSMELFHRLFID